jgi:hypothetical protein
MTRMAKYYSWLEEPAFVLQIISEVPYHPCPKIVYQRRGEWRRMRNELIFNVSLETIFLKESKAKFAVFKAFFVLSMWRSQDKSAWTITPKIRIESTFPIVLLKIKQFKFSFSVMFLRINNNDDFSGCNTNRFVRHHFSISLRVVLTFSSSSPLDLATTEALISSAYWIKSAQPTGEILNLELQYLIKD